MRLLSLCLLALVVPTGALRGTFYAAGARNATIDVHQPWATHYFFETLHRHQHVTYRLAEPLMRDHRDAVFFFRFLVPALHSETACSGVRVVVEVPGHSNTTYVMDGLGTGQTLEYEPFTQTPLARIGREISFEGTFSATDGFGIFVTGSANYSNCNVVFVLGNNATYDWALPDYPYVTFAAWGWAYGDVGAYVWVFLVSLCVPLFALDVRRPLPYNLMVLGAAFYVATFTTRLVVMISAVSIAPPRAAGVVGSLLFVLIVDLFFAVVAVASVYGRRTYDAVEAVVDASCFLRVLKLPLVIFRDFEEQPVALKILYALLITSSFFLVGAGAWGGPAFILLGTALLACGSVSCSCPVRSRGRSIRIWA
jgi:hypothetical protein